MKYTWYSNTVKPNLPDMVQQTLAFGCLADILSLRKNLGQEKMRDIFLRFPKKIYTASSLNFAKKFILLVNKPIDEEKYLKYAPGNIR